MDSIQGALEKHCRGFSKWKLYRVKRGVAKLALNKPEGWHWCSVAEGKSPCRPSTPRPLSSFLTLNQSQSWVRVLKYLLLTLHNCQAIDTGTSFVVFKVAVTLSLTHTSVLHSTRCGMWTTSNHSPWYEGFWSTSIVKWHDPLRPVHLSPGRTLILLYRRERRALLVHTLHT